MTLVTVPPVSSASRRPLATASSAARAAARRTKGMSSIDAAPVDVFERPVLLPLFGRQGPRPAIDIAHRLDVLARVGKKALPFFGMIGGRRAFDAEQPDQLLAVLLLALAAERARGAFKIGRQVGDAGLNHRIDDALRLEEGKSERRVIPDRGVEARVPRGKGRATIEGGAEIVRRVVPIQDRAVGMPCESRSVADGVSQNDRARRDVGGVAESVPAAFRSTALATSKSIQLRSLALNIVSSSKSKARPLQSASPLGAHPR